MEEHFPAMHVRLYPSLWSALERCGIAPAEVARHARLPLASPRQAMSLTMEQSYAFWAAVRELSGDRPIGLEIARSLDLADAPPMILAPYHARDWRDAIHRIARYKQMCAPERVRVREEGDSCVVEVEWVRPHAESAIVTELMFAALMELGRRGTRVELAARSVELQRPRGDASAYEAYFGCAVRLGAAASRLVLHRSDLDRPFASYNAELLEMLSPALERALADHQSRNSFSGQVKWLMKRRLATKRPDMRGIAKELAVSERTLQRRLADEGTRFQDVLTGARRELAREYLANGQLDMADVAFLLGFDDQNSFFRAFRQWEGETPARWRALRLGVPRGASGRAMAGATH
ncbi:MAG TPA: AraC family transcriptional regulator ligand-binding domain-containing protein [Usitatibacter sp.]|nr:AraC family transcriptional regulator ligand-binding domain-containing protein [Usitatibacter sp.]